NVAIPATKSRQADLRPRGGDVRQDRGVRYRTQPLRIGRSPMTIFTPSTATEVRSSVQWAASEEAPLEIIGHGSKRGIGRPSQAAHTLELSKLSGVTLYEPAELVLSARAGTPLAEIEQLLADNGQQLAFEPMDFSALLGS